MNWFANFYLREGPGIPKDAPKPEGLRLLLSVLAREWWDLIKLNLLFVAFSLPLVTLPAAWFAAVRISVAMIEDRNVWLWRDFWSAFRSRFWIVTVLGASILANVVVSVFAVRSYVLAAQDSLLFAGPLAIAATVAVLVPLYGAYLFVALADKVNQSVADAAKAASIALLARPLPGLAALGFTGLLWLAHIMFYPASVLLPVLVNFSLGALVTSFAVLGSIRFGFAHVAAVPHYGTTGRPKTQSA